MSFSQATPSAPSVSAAWRMVSQSDWLPMMMAIGAGMSLILLTESKTQGRIIGSALCAARLARDRQWTILSWCGRASLLEDRPAGGVKIKAGCRAVSKPKSAPLRKNDEEKSQGERRANCETAQGRAGSRQDARAPRRSGPAASGGKGRCEG